MQLNKRFSETTLTQASKSQKSTLLVLKKKFSKQQKDTIVFDFEDRLIERASQNWSVSQILPVFNKDKKFYTPTFILKIDQPKYYIRDPIYRSLHHQRIQLDCCQPSQLYLPKPHQSNYYCIICQSDYQDYQKHIRQKIHIQKMNRSTFISDIKQLCGKFGNSTQQSSLNTQKVKKIKVIKKRPKYAKLKVQKDEHLGFIN